MSAAKAKGTRREHKVRDVYVLMGYVVIRPGGSLGAADLVALKAGDDPLFIQVKANSGSPWMNFRRAERRLLANVAAQAGAVPLLAHWPAGGTLRLYGRSEWPLFDGLDDPELEAAA